METIQTSARQREHETDARVDVDAVARQQGPVHLRREITDETAVSIAAWYQSPGTVGHVLASLASHMPVDVEALLDDIARTRQGVSDSNGERYFEYACLDCLATWAINHPSRKDRP